MNFSLLITPLRDYNLTSVHGEAVVRTYTKISALLRSRVSSPLADGLLAQPNFTDTDIEWTTSRFDNLPRPMTALSPDEKKHYRNILGGIMESIRRSALTGSHDDDDVANTLSRALTCPSEDCIFCADSRIVIAAWGLSPRTAANPIINLISLDDTTPEPQQPVQVTSHKDVIPPAPETVSDVKPESKEPKQEKEKIKETVTPKKTAENTKVETSPKVLPPVKKQEKKRSRSLLWLWIIIAAIILTLALIFGLRSCSPNDTVADIPKTTPEITKDKIVLSSDSLNYEVSDRLVILLNSGGTLDDMMKQLRTHYPDKSVYTFSDPDTILNRVIMTMPPEERLKMLEDIPSKLSPRFDVTVLKENVQTTHARPNDPAFANKAQSYYFDMVHAPEAWDITTGKKDVVVAVIDDGFDLTHPEMQGKIVKPYNVVTRNSKVFPSKVGHGQHVAGTVAGRAGNRSGACGIAPGVKIMPVQVFDANGTSTMSWVIDGIIYAINNGADVINLSLGQYFGPMMKFMPLSYQQQIAEHNFLQEAALYDRVYREAEARGIVIVKGAGNENILASLDPANRSQVAIVVSAVGSKLEQAIFSPSGDASNHGSRTDISAPGLAIYNSLPGGKYGNMQGTSMAAPQVSGGAALVRSRFPKLSPSQIKEVLMCTADPVNADNVAPIMNLASALNCDPDNLPPAPGRGDEDYCGDVAEVYNALMDKAHELERRFPNCVKQRPDTLTIPRNPTTADFNGRWKSTSSIVNLDDGTPVTLYFDFNGTSAGTFTCVEEDGSTSTAPFTISIKGDKIHISMTSPTSGANAYNPYDFLITPDKSRHAQGKAANKIQKFNRFDFTLVRVS